jgi:hypothetical protein
MRNEKLKAWLLLIVAAALFAWALISFIGKRSECAARGLEPVRTFMAWQWSCGKVEP